MSILGIASESARCRPAPSHAVVVASTAIAPTRRHRPRRAGAALLAAASLVAACSSGGGDGERAATTTAGAAAVRCPDGSTVPRSAATVAPAPVDPRPSGPSGRDGALDVGTLLPRTGDLAFLGPAALAGVELAVADLAAAGGVLGQPVGLRHGDSAEGVPGTAGAEVARLLADGADVIVGPLSSGAAANVLDAVVAADAVLVSPASASSGLDALDRTGRLFRTGPTEALQGRALGTLALSDGHETVAIAARADDHGRAVADALTARLEEGGASVVARVDYDPSDPDLGDAVADRVSGPADAIVLVGLAETALVLDALVEGGDGPRDRAVYGTDGNLGERLADLVADEEALACFRGLLPVDRPGASFTDRLRQHSPSLADAGAAALDLGAESYDATVAAALAAATAGSDGGDAIAGAMAEVTSGGTTCHRPRPCLELIAGGTDVSYVGQTGRLALGDDGNRTEAGLTEVAFDAGGHLTRLGTRRARG